MAATGAKYYLIYDFLDMKPISTATTDMDEILITRKAKRINSNIRKEFSSYDGRMNFKKYYTEFLLDNTYYSDVFQRFIEHIFSQIKNEELIESDILKIGYFLKFNVSKSLHSRIINEVKGINRVVYDITSKPPRD